MAKTYEKYSLLSDFTEYPSQEIKECVLNIENRLMCLYALKDKAVIYEFLSEYYEEKSYDKATKYNSEALLYKDSLELRKEAKIYAREARIEMCEKKYKDALKNIVSAINADPENNNYIKIEIEILLKLNELDNVIEQLIRIEKDERINKNILQLADTLILMARYYSEIDDVNKALKNFKEAYKLIENVSDEILSSKKIYLIAEIVSLENNNGNELLQLADKGIEIFSSKYFSIKHRLNLLELAELLYEHAMQFFDIDKYETSIQYFQKSLDIFNKSYYSEYSTIESIYHHLALSYFNIEKYIVAIGYEKKAMVLNENSNEYYYLRHNYNNIAYAYKLINNQNESTYFYRKNIHLLLYLRMEDSVILAFSLLENHLFENLDILKNIELRKGTRDRGLSFP